MTTTTPGLHSDPAAQARSPRSSIVRPLAALIDANAWRGRFEEAIVHVSLGGVRSLARVDSLDAYFAWLDALVGWASPESGD